MASDKVFLYSLFFKATFATKLNIVVNSLGTIVLSLIAVVTFLFKFVIESFKADKALLSLRTVALVFSSLASNLVINCL